MAINLARSAKNASFGSKKTPNAIGPGKYNLVKEPEQRTK